MSNAGWQGQLHKALQRQRMDDQPLRIAVMGIGNDLRNDDRLGIEIVRQLKTKCPGDRDILLIEAGQMPENFCSALRKYRPHLVLLLDAAHFGDHPGEVQWINRARINDLLLSTHSMPLSQLAYFLEVELSCEVGIIGVQPADTSFGETVSFPVRSAIEEVSAYLMEEISHAW